MKSFFESRGFTITLIVIGALIILLIVFRAGITVGYRRGLFSSEWGEEYQRNFIEPNSMPGFHRDFIGGHEAIGSIIKIDTDQKSLVIQDQGDAEKEVLIGSQTLIRQFNQTLTSADLKLDEHVAVIGSPDDQGRIVAELIRVLPPPSNASSTPSLPQ
jgi:hypothetical protein